MPAVGERKTKGGVTGEWDGTTWRQVSAAAPASSEPTSAGPTVGTRKTKNGITGEWDGTTWRQVDATGEPEVTPDKPSGAGAAAAGVGLAALAGAVPIVRRVAEHVATSPLVGRAVSGLTKAAAPLNVGMQAYEVLSGRKSLGSAAVGAAKGEAVRQGIKLAPRAAGAVASTLGAEGVAGMAAPLAVPLAGGLAGLAGTAGFLGALQHDANRTVEIDYSKHTPDTAVARVFSNMRDSEKNRSRTLAERQDDPNDVMFTPDDTATVQGSGGGSRVSAAVQAFFGRR
jgi:hypothetical protein